MIEAPAPENEEQRLAFLRDMKILDTSAEERFDRITRIVCRVLNVPISAISIVDEKRQWFKSSQGLSVCETSRGVAFCAHAILDCDPLIIADALSDERFFDNPLVVGDPNIRFYAGFPINLGKDVRIGTLCAIDTKPRELSAEQIEVMNDLRRIVESEFQAITLTELTIALKNAEARAISASQKKSRFLANMSHEIRTPLHGVITTAEILSNTPLEAQQSEYVHIIQQSGQLLMEIVNDILDFSKIEAGKLKFRADDFSPTQLIEDSVELFRQLANNKGLYIRTRLNPSIPSKLRGDRILLRQILGNLISNAIKFTERGGVVVSSEVDQAPSGAIQLKVSVHDTGVGMGQTELAGLFEPFFRADSYAMGETAGSGLGLAISKRYVEAMNGSINVDSKVGGGSTFWFTVELQPALDDEFTAGGSTPNALTTPSVPEQNFDGCHVLVAEDVNASRLILSRILEKLGCRVDAVSNGLEALRMMRDGHYDLILMDCQMPVMDGYTATRLIREEGRCEIPIVALTADATEENREKGIKAGIDEYLSKPFAQSELVAIMSRLVKRSSARA